MAKQKCKMLDLQNTKKVLESVDVVLCDCDGVLWTGDRVISGAPDAIDKLKAMGKKIFYVTNNSSKSRKEYVHKFLGMGYHVVDDEIFGASYVTAECLKTKYNYQGKVYCIGSEGLASELRLCNIHPTEIGPDPLAGRSVSEIEEYQLDRDVRCVVVGLDYDFSFVKAAKAVMYLQKKSCLFVATNTDSNLPTTSGRLMPCAGSIVAMVQTGCQRLPDVVCGKPNQAIYDVIASKQKIDRRRTLFIGDRLSTDMLFAGRAGFQSLFVLSGVSTMDDVHCKETSMSEEDQRSIPNYFTASLGELARLL